MKSMIAAARSQLTTRYSKPRVGAWCTEAWAITSAGGKPRFMVSAIASMWCAPVRHGIAGARRVVVGHARGQRRAGERVLKHGAPSYINMPIINPLYEINRLC